MLSEKAERIAVDFAAWHEINEVQAIAAAQTWADAVREDAEDTEAALLAFLQRKFLAERK